MMPKKSEYEKLEKKKVTKDLSILKDYAITDPANVCGIFPFIKTNAGEINEIDCSLGFFKHIENPEIIMETDSSFYKGEVVIIEGTRYSMELIDQCKQIAKVWFSDKPKILMAYDKKTNKIIQDNPLMLVFDDRMCFVIAPRIET